MKRIALTLIAVAFLGGCAKDVEKSKPSTEELPASETTEPAETATAQTEVDESTSEKTEASEPINAESLLAATLTQATAEDKRVMVHLGAPW